MTGEPRQTAFSRSTALRFRVAVIGGGPSGFYASEALLRSGLPCGVDMFERLPTPYGLVRFGVAPDHPKLKQVTSVFDRIAAMPGFRFVGGLQVGVDLPLNVLRECYDAVILATGASVDRGLGIEGESLDGCHSAGDFVGWYNGHPDQAEMRFDLSGERAVVVGHGNVALDVARVLLKTPDELRQTDIAKHALEALSESRIREVQIVGRRGLADTRFSAKELREFEDLTDCATMLDPEDYGVIDAEDAAGTSDGQAISPWRRFTIGSAGKSKRCVFRFNLTPSSITGAGKVETMHFHRNGETEKNSDEVVALACGLVFSSIGRRVAQMVDVPFDESNCVHANVSGRIVAGGVPVNRLYVCGWGKRGPQGTIGSNRPCSVETVEHVCADLLRLGARESANDRSEGILKSAIGSAVDYASWKRIDAHEIALGLLVGRPREKLVRVNEMLSAGRSGDA